MVTAKKTCYAEAMPTSYGQYQRRSKFKLIFQVLPLVLIVIASLFGVSQLKTVRDFLSRAKGEPANIVIDTQGVLGPMPRPWRNLAQGGEEANWRIQPIASQVKALNPRYIRIDHIYDFYDIVKGTPGNLSFDFSKFDLLLDDIAATGAKPYIALSYMPPAISSGDIISTPKNWADWQLTVQKTIEHVSGTRNTPDVYYEVWNEPDLFGGFKYYGNKSYMTMYEYAAKGAVNAKVRQPFKIGGPAITALYKNWFDAMCKYVLDNHLRMDFFSWHRYNTDVEQYQQDMNNVKTWVQAYPQLEPTLEFHITEWGHDSNNHPGYDTNYGAAHTVAGAIEMVNVIDNAFVFEIQDGKDPKGAANWGRWGMFTHADAGAKPKPRYRALRMLDRISNQRLQLNGKGYWVKALAALNDQGETEVVIANYDAQGKHGEKVPVTFTNIEPGNYSITKEFLSGQQSTEQTATTAAALQTFVTLTPNNVAFVKLKKI